MSYEYCEIKRDEIYFEENKYEISYKIEKSKLYIFNGYEFRTFSIFGIVNFEDMYNFLDLPKDVEKEILNTLLNDIDKCCMFLD